MNTSTSKNIVIITDVFSTGAVMASMLHQEGYSVVACLSGPLGDLMSMVPQNLKIDYMATIIYDVEKDPDTALAEMINSLNLLDGKIECVIAGAETGVLLGLKIFFKYYFILF
jgi:CheY-like chemotaxis protein